MMINYYETVVPYLFFFSWSTQWNTVERTGQCLSHVSLVGHTLDTCWSRVGHVWYSPVSFNLRIRQAHQLIRRSVHVALSSNQMLILLLPSVLVACVLTANCPLWYIGLTMFRHNTSVHKSEYYVEYTA